MKKLTLVAAIFCFLATNAQVINQQVNPDRELGLAYMKYGKNFNIAAWSLLSAGTIVSAIGLSQFDLFSDDNKGVVLIGIGGAMMFGSIPLFVAGGINNKKARVILKNENVPLSIKGLDKSYYALGLAINL